MSLCTVCLKYGHMACSCPGRPRGTATGNTSGSHCHPLPLPPLVVAGVAMAALAMGACSSTEAAKPSAILAPAARLMTPPAAIPAVPKVGDDLVVAHLRLLRSYSRETSRLTSLQGYVKTLRGAR